MLGLISIQLTEMRVYKFKIKKELLQDNIESFSIILNKKHIDNKKVYKKVFNRIYKSNYEKIVISNDIYDNYNELLLNITNSDINVVKGNIMYIQLLDKLLDYIFKLNTNSKIEEMNLGIALDNVTYSKLEFIRLIANKVRGITLLTNTPAKYENLANEILENTGLSINVNNNFKNGLKKCNICINMDIDNKQLINCIPSRCIYINCNNEIKKIRKNFKGIVVNDIIVENNEFNGFRSLAITQALELNIKDINILYTKGFSKEISDDEYINFKFLENKSKQKC